MEDREYISNQISRFMTNKKLIETLNYLEVAPVNKFATLHSKGDIIDNKKIYSIIKVNIQDFSFGKGDRTKKASYNLSTSDIAYIFHKIRAYENFNIEREKTFNGKVAKLFLEKCANSIKVTIENGTGEDNISITGGMYLNKDTYKIKTKVSINLSDDDFFKLIYETYRFIEIWEMTYCTNLIKEGTESLKSNMNN